MLYFGCVSDGELIVFWLIHGIDLYFLWNGVWFSAKLVFVRTIS